MGDKNRLDMLLVDKGFFDSREKAKKSIMAGIIFVDGQRVDKAGTKIEVDADIQIKGKTCPYVSRGGLKLEKAMKTFPIHLENKVAADIGASTGGFTDCMLINGASKVYAVDVGYGQLAWKLRQDPKVVVMERTNIRYVTKKEIQEEIEFASIDVSFISLKLVLPVVKTLLKQRGEVICLIKPQFEAGREKVGRKGVVRDVNVHKEVVFNILNFAKEIGFCVKGVTFSPIKGPEGNIEYLAYLANETNMESIDIHDMSQKIVNLSHEDLDKK